VSRRVRILGIIGTLALLVPLASCDDSGPQGPGTYEATVTRSAGLPPAGVVVDVVGPGITGVTGSGPTQVWTAPISGGQGLRVIAVNTGIDDPVQFRIDVSDVGAAAPEVVVRMGTDGDNRHITAVATYRVDLTR
jgi:hypothetical protein